MAQRTALARQDKRCENCPVRHHAVCSALGEADHHKLSDIMVHRHLTRGSLIIHQDEDSSLVAIILSGTIMLTSLLPDGRRQIVGLLSEGDTVGNVFSSLNDENAECITDVHLCCFSRKSFNAVLKSHPELEHRLFQKGLEDLRDARQWMIALGRKTALERVAAFLIWLQKKNQSSCLRQVGQNDFTTITLPLSRLEIGDFLGLTIETVSRTLTKLKSSGVIHLLGSREIEICDPDELRRLAEPRE